MSNSNQEASPQLRTYVANDNTHVYTEWNCHGLKRKNYFMENTNEKKFYQEDCKEIGNFDVQLTPFANISNQGNDNFLYNVSEAHDNTNNYNVNDENMVLLDFDKTNHANTHDMQTVQSGLYKYDYEIDTMQTCASIEAVTDVYNDNWNSLDEYKETNNIQKDVFCRDEELDYIKICSKTLMDMTTAPQEEFTMQDLIIIYDIMFNNVKTELSCKKDNISVENNFNTILMKNTSISENKSCGKILLKETPIKCDNKEQLQLDPIEDKGAIVLAIEENKDVHLYRILCKIKNIVTDNLFSKILYYINKIATNSNTKEASLLDTSISYEKIIQNLRNSVLTANDMLFGCNIKMHIDELFSDYYDNDINNTDTHQVVHNIYAQNPINNVILRNTNIRKDINVAYLNVNAIIKLILNVHLANTLIHIVDKQNFANNLYKDIKQCINFLFSKRAILPLDMEDKNSCDVSNNELSLESAKNEAKSVIDLVEAETETRYKLNVYEQTCTSNEHYTIEFEIPAFLIVYDKINNLDRHNHNKCQTTDDSNELDITLKLNETLPTIMKIHNELLSIIDGIRKTVKLNSDLIFHKKSFDSIDEIIENYSMNIFTNYDKITITQRYTNYKNSDELFDFENTLFWHEIFNDINFVRYETFFRKSNENVLVQIKFLLNSGIINYKLYHAILCSEFSNFCTFDDLDCGKLLHTLFDFLYTLLLKKDTNIYSIIPGFVFLANCISSKTLQYKKITVKQTFVYLSMLQIFCLLIKIDWYTFFVANKQAGFHIENKKKTVNLFSYYSIAYEISQILCYLLIPFSEILIIKNILLIIEIEYIHVHCIKSSKKTLKLSDKVYNFQYGRYNFASLLFLADADFFNGFMSSEVSAADTAYVIFFYSKHFSLNYFSEKALARKRLEYTFSLCYCYYATLIMYGIPNKLKNRLIEFLIAIKSYKSTMEELAYLTDESKSRYVKSLEYEKYRSQVTDCLNIFIDVYNDIILKLFDPKT
ncbi:hypothetical protein COBT_001726 [Conglomerata obtusa]